jgi:hypothetical protein
MPSYSPERRTAVILSGTGAHGAYHAGALRALQEAGVKIDILAGHGVGAAGAAVAAIDGQARLWEADGLWSSASIADLYGWTRLVRWAAMCALAVVAVLLGPPLLIALASVPIYAIGFVAETLGAGGGVIAAHADWLRVILSGPLFSTTVPRLLTIVVALLGSVLAAGAWLEYRRTPPSRRGDGQLWWRVAGAPIDSEQARRLVVDAVWGLIRGAAPVASPAFDAVSRRYTDVLRENLGQPGFRELLLVATDLDGRRDLVGALLAEPFRAEFFAAHADRDRRADVLDLAGAGRERTMDLVAGALTPPVVCEPFRAAFAPESHWRGETHRLCDRPGSVNRLLEAAATAGATQAIVVTAIAPSEGPHQLGAAGVDVRSRLGAFVAAAEAAALRDGLEMARLRFDGVYLVRPAHSPLGPFDMDGAYDRASDRRQELRELTSRGYEDAYRQFIEPVVGASGDHLARSPEGHTTASRLLDDARGGGRP